MDRECRERGGSCVISGEDRIAKPRRGDFEKLVMLIDNNERGEAMKFLGELMRFSYSPSIDSGLEAVQEALSSFYFSKALEEANKLLDLVKKERESAVLVKKSILAIDDIPNVLRTLKVMLNDKYNVYCMTSYDSALKFLRSKSVDLIILDIEMPEIDGFAMLQLFRTLPEYANTPIVFLTGNESDEYVKTAMSLGAQDYIKKPVDLTVLLEKLDRAITQCQGS